MKLQGKGIDAFVRAPDPRVRAVLLYGPDTGLVKERAEVIGRHVVADLNDPFRVGNLATRAIAEDPARLVDEVAALAMTGGRRLVRVRDADESVAPAFTGLLDAMPPGDTLVVLEAGDLPARSRLRALFEASPIAAALPAYVEDEASLGAVIADLLRGHRLTADPDAITFLSGNLVGDRLVARGEIEKLALYMLGRSRVTLEDAIACVGDSGEPDPDEPVWSAADGDFAGLDRSLRRLFAEGASAVAILRAAQRHFQRLHMVAGSVAGGRSPDAAVEALKPPVFYKLRSRFVGQARRWNANLVRQALERLLDTEAEVKRTGMPDETLCARVLFQIASMGRR